jgi:hypothetical protein
VHRASELSRIGLTLLVAASYALLLSNRPPLGPEWHDTHFQVGMLLGAVAAVDAIALLQRQKLPPLALGWIAILAYAGLVLALSCWMQLGVRTIS